MLNIQIHSGPKGFETQLSSIPFVRVSNISPERAAFSRVKGWVKEELSKYPSGYFESFATHIVLAKSISSEVLTSSDLVTGTYSVRRESVVFLNMSASEGQIRRAVHHEFSSLVFLDNQWLIEPLWQLANPKNFQYSSKINNETAFQANRDFFVTEYALNSLENDLNCLAEVMFCPSDQEIAVIRGRLPLIKKLKLFRDVYVASGFKAGFPVDRYNLWGKD